jgi:hypothetical protein
MLVAGNDTDGTGADWLYDDEFFSESDLELMDYEIAELRKHIDPVELKFDYGVFPGETMSNHIVIDGAFKWWLTDRIKQSGYVNQDFIVGGCNAVTLYKPFDIHNDYIYRYFNGGKEWVPWMNFIIPLSDTNSKTVVFNEYNTQDRATYPFNQYKDDHGTVDNPVAKDIWDANCSHCWETDREYVSLQKIMPEQKRGMLTGLKSKFYHCSDHFHLTDPNPKQFIHVRTGIHV